MQEVQQRLIENADDIKVACSIQILFENYPHLFKYKLYESFKPETLKQVRNYIEFLTTSENDANGCLLSEEDLSPELYNYLSKEVETKLPKYINQKKLL